MGISDSQGVCQTRVLLPIFSIIIGQTYNGNSWQIEMKEEDRLAAIVARIDEEVGVVPRGAYMKNPLGEVVLNKSFQGRSSLIPDICQGIRV